MNAVKYAETQLNVHDVYERARGVADDLQEALQHAADARHDLRGYHERVEAREAELTSEHRGANPDMSATAFKDYIKIVHQQDSALVELRENIRDAQRVLDENEAKAEASRYRLRMESARMEELGGLLRFYGAAKEESLGKQGARMQAANAANETSETGEAE